MSLTLTSCRALNPYVFDTTQGEIVRSKDNQIERISCYEEKLNRFACFNQKDLQIINRCMKRCNNKK